MTTPSRPTYERFAQFWAQSYVGFLRPEELLYATNITGQYNLWSQPLGRRGEPGRARALTLFRDQTVRVFEPSRDGHTVYFAADQDGDEQFQIYRLDTRGGDPVPITHDRKVRHELSAGSLDRTGRRLLYSDNGRAPQDMDVVLHDLVKGTTLRPLPEGNLWAGAAWDSSGNRFTVVKYVVNTEMHTYVHDVRKRTTVEVLPHDTEEIVVPVDWSHDGRRLLIVTDMEGEYQRLELVDWPSGKRRVLVSRSADIDFVRHADRGDRIVYGLNEGGYTSLWTGPLTGPFRRVGGLPRGHVAGLFDKVVALSPDGRMFAVGWMPTNAPPEVYLVSLEGGHPRQITDNMPGGVPDAPQPPPQLIHFSSFDGRKIPAFYYRPKHRPKGKAAAVLSIHGGPETQELPGWDYYGFYHYLMSQGIYVLAPNIRGSTGYGRSYQRLIHRDWGGDELKDLRAAAEWLRSRPELDPERLGVFGGSFGGFATLSCVTRLPEYWKVGVDIVGPSNLVTFAKATPPFWHRFLKRWMGDPDTEADFLLQRSPITYLDNVRADLLILQGANDPRVNKAESDQIVEKLRAMGRTVDYVVFPDEGHGFTKTENILKAIGTTARYLAEHLNGATVSTT